MGIPDYRIGVYKCTIANGVVGKDEPSYLRGDYIGVFTWDDLISRIIPDLRQYRLKASDYPILITSWRLKEGVVPKPSPVRTIRKPSVKAVGGLRNLKRMLGMPVRRRKDPRSEIWEAVVDSTDRAFKVEGQKVIYPADWNEGQIM